MRNNIYAHEFEKNGIKKCKKVYLNYPPGGEELLICDSCDDKKKLASITMLCGDVACICRDCLLKIVFEFEEGTDWEKWINKKKEKTL